MRSPSLRTGFLLAACCITLAGCGKFHTLTILSPDGQQNTALTVEVDDTPETRNQGLKNRTIPKDQGVLFAFPDAGMLTISMRDVKIPLSAIYFDAKGEMVGSDEMSMCKTIDICKPYTSPEIAKYMLIANAGFRAAHGIKVGWKLDMNQVHGMTNPK